MRGFFEIGIEHLRYPQNIGTLWRSAYQLGASGIFTVGQRASLQTSDTCKAWRHIPLRCFETLAALKDALPCSTPLIGIEMHGEPLETFNHPERACYLLGAEDHGLTREAQRLCHYIVSLSAIRNDSYNVSVAGSIVMYHRQFSLKTPADTQRSAVCQKS